jgi:hypothetical protein
MLLTLVLAFCAGSSPPPHAQAVSESGDYVMVHFRDVASAFAALEAGELDLVGNELAPVEYEAAQTNPNLVVAPSTTPGCGWAWSRDLHGLTTINGTGPMNPYTFIRAYKIDVTRVLIGLVAPSDMSIIHPTPTSQPSLALMNLYGGLAHPPYDPNRTQAGWVQDWEVTTWTASDNTTNTLVKRWFRSDSYFAKPETGTKGPQAKASDYFFSCWYTHAHPTSELHPTVQALHHIDIVNDQHVEIYFDEENPQFEDQAAPPLLPVDTWLQPPLATRAVETFVEGINLTTPTAVGLASQPVWFESVRADGTPLTIFADYNIIKGELHLLAELAPSAVVEVDYWAVGDASGSTAGGLPWQTVFEGAGMFYATAFTPGVGGNLTLERNPYYWMERPLLGELDFVWRWEEGPKPRRGYYKIDIFDVVMAVNAYGSQGTGVPSENWLPGADNAPEGGKVDIFDLVSQTGPYGYEWGRP